MTPIERAARALGEAIGQHIDPDCDYDAVVENGVRAVIAAIREPSEGMIDAMYDEYEGGGKGSLRDCWFEGIDTLLKEAP